MKILVIDNDRERIRILKSLEAKGHLAQSTASPDEAMDILSQTAVQILILGPQALAEVPALRSAASEMPCPWVVGMGGETEGIDHSLPLPLDPKVVSDLLVLPGISPEPEPVDTAKALDICDNDKELFREIIQIFLNDGPRRLEKLETGLAAKDWKAVAEAAHLMKGSSLNLAAKPLLQTCRRLEQAGDAGDPGLIALWAGQVMYEYRRLARRLQGLIDDPPRPSK